MTGDSDRTDYAFTSLAEPNYVSYARQCVAELGAESGTCRHASATGRVIGALSSVEAERLGVISAHEIELREVGNEALSG